MLRRSKFSAGPGLTLRGGALAARLRGEGGVKMPQRRFAVILGAALAAALLTVLGAAALGPRLDLGDYGLGVPLKLAMVAVLLLWLMRRGR